MKYEKDGQIKEAGNINSIVIEYENVKVILNGRSAEIAEAFIKGAIPGVGDEIPTWLGAIIKEKE